jgi:hypothetical protein
VKTLAIPQSRSNQPDYDSRCNLLSTRSFALLEQHQKVRHYAMIPLSILDLSPIVEGGTAAQSFRNTVDLARHAERWGYNRFWLAEHHGMPGIGSAATAVLIGHVAGGTSTIRVGSGGIIYIRAASTLGLAARRDRIRQPLARCAEISLPMHRHFRRMSRN